MSDLTQAVDRVVDEAAQLIDENRSLQRRMDAVRAYLVEVNAEMRDAPRPTAYLDGWMDGVLKLSGDVMALLDGEAGDE